LKPGIATITLKMENWTEGQVQGGKANVLIQKGKPPAKDEPVSAKLAYVIPHPQRDASIWDLKWSVDNKQLLVTGYPSGVVQLFNTSNWKELRRIETVPGYRGSAEYAAVPNDFSKLYVPAQKRRAKQIELPDGEPGIRMEYSGEIRSWNLQTGERLANLAFNKDSAGEMIMISPNGQYIVYNEDKTFEGKRTAQRPNPTLKLRDLKNDKVMSLPIAGFSQVVFTPDSTRFIVASSDRQTNIGTLQVLDSATGKLVQTLAKFEKNQIYWPLLTTDAKTLIAEIRSTEGEEAKAEIGFWSLVDGQLLGRVPTNSRYVFKIKLSPDGSKVFFNSVNPSKIGCVDVQSRKVIFEEKVDEKERRQLLAISHDNKTIACELFSASPDILSNREVDPNDLPQSRVKLIDLETGKVRETLIGPRSYLMCATFSPDGKWLIAGGMGQTLVFDLTK
jgi:WD40 repeat protein